MSTHVAIIISSIAISIALFMLVSKRRILIRIGISSLAILVLIVTGCSYHQPAEQEIKQQAFAEKKASPSKSQREKAIEKKVEPYLVSVNPYIIRDDFKNHLTDEEKASFYQIIDAIIKYDKEVELKTNMYSNILIDYLIHEHPYADLIEDTRFDETYQTYHIEYVYSFKQHQAMLKTIQDFYLTLINQNIQKEMNDVDKTLAIYQAVATYLSYDYDWLQRFQASEDPYHFPEISQLEGILRKQGVCHTYCYMMQFALQQVGVECVLIEGNYHGNYDDSHVWGMVKLNNQYYHLDPTWDDQEDKNEVSLHYFGMRDAQREQQGFTLRSGNYNVECGEIHCDDDTFETIQDVNSYHYLKNHQWEMTSDSKVYIYTTLP